VLKAARALAVAQARRDRAGAASPGQAGA